MGDRPGDIFRLLSTRRFYIIEELKTIQTIFELYFTHDSLPVPARFGTAGMKKMMGIVVAVISQPDKTRKKPLTNLRYCGSPVSG